MIIEKLKTATTIDEFINPYIDSGKSLVLQTIELIKQQADQLVRADSRIAELEDKLSFYEIKDLDKTNNDISNLEYITHSQNIIHARKQKTWNSGRKKGFKHTIETKRKQCEAHKKNV